MEKYISKGIELYLAPTELSTTGLPSEAQSVYEGYTSEMGREDLLGGLNAKLGHLIPDVQEIGDLSAGASAERDKIEVTTLADDKHVFAEGLLTDAEYDSIDFTMLYTPKVYKTILNMIGVEKSLSQYGFKNTYKVVIPNLDNDNVTVFTNKGSTAVKFNGVAVNGALQMTLTVTPKEEIAFDNAVAKA